MTTNTSTEPAALLCFGDSDTWGTDPRTRRRLGRSDRWPGRLQIELGPRFYVIEAGLEHRTTVWSDPLAGDVNGSTHLGPLLAAHHPLDLVILMMGASELGPRFNHSADKITAGIEVLARTILQSEPWPGGGSPQLLVVSPPPMDFPLSVDTNKHGESRDLACHVADLADRLQCRSFDAGLVSNRVGPDGLYLDSAAHLALAESLRTVVSEMLDVL